MMLVFPVAVSPTTSTLTILSLVEAIVIDCDMCETSFDLYE